MNIHDDLALAASVDAAALEWVPSPMAGVERRMIERKGVEVARATSLVRYAPNSTFPAHAHGGGEEFLVLAGVFSDESGDYPAGSYVRNGVGSHHSPRTAPGCVILVKLWWMHPDETQSARVMTADPTNWNAQSWGATCPLYHGDYDKTDLMRVSAAQRIELSFTDGIELFVVSGSVLVDGCDAGEWSWTRQPGQGTLSIEAQSTATIFVKRLRLQTPPPLPD